MFMRKFCAFLSSVSRGDRGEMVPRTPRAPFHIEAELPRADQDVSVLPPPPARSDEKGFFTTGKLKGESIGVSHRSRAKFQAVPNLNQDVDPRHPTYRTSKQTK